GTIITLPGVPSEMRYLMKHTIVPYLQRRLGRQEVLVTRVLRTVAVGESRVDQALSDLEVSSNPTVGLSAHPGQTDVRIVAKAPTQAEAEALVAEFETTVRERLGAAIYASGDATLEAVIAELLQQNGATLAVAETMTNGDLARRLSAHPQVFCGSAVAADGSALAQLLSLPEGDYAAEPGAVALAEGIRRAWQASYGLAITSDESERAWVAIATDRGTDTRRLRFQGRDLRARVWTTTLSLEFLRRSLLGLADGWAD
ncbi:MAG: CinA family protein, partial [Anaerolineae bacterium]